MRREHLMGRAALVVAAVCAVVVAGTAVVLFVPAVRNRLGPAPAVAYVAGDRIDVPASVYEGSPSTIILFARSDCGVCQRAKPFFGALVARARALSDARVVMATRQLNFRDEVTYAHEIGLDETQIVALDLSRLHLRRVPTVVLVNQQGSVRYVLEGLPAATAQESVLTDLVARAGAD